MPLQKHETESLSFAVPAVVLLLVIGANCGRVMSCLHRSDLNSRCHQAIAKGNDRAIEILCTPMVEEFKDQPAEDPFQ